MGFTKIYNHTYDYITTDSEIVDLRNRCNADSVLCVGGGIRGDDNMRLVACGNCLSVLSVTALNTPNYVGSAYWYYTPDKSFGFSPSSSISQTICDSSNQNDNLRLCWHTDNQSGGWRLGNITYLNSDSGYSKYVFLKMSKTTFFIKY